MSSLTPKNLKNMPSIQRVSIVYSVHSLLCLTVSSLHVSPYLLRSFTLVILEKGVLVRRIPACTCQVTHEHGWTRLPVMTLTACFCLHTSLCVSLARNSKSDTVLMKSPELRGSGQTCCSDALQTQADKKIKTMTAKFER